MKIRNITLLTLVVFLCVLMWGCENLLEIDSPSTKVSSDIVFRDDATATSAVTGMYTRMLENLSFSSGSSKSVTALAALSADEFVNNFPENNREKQFYDNDILPNNDYILSLWTSAYKVIYQSNDIIEGLQNAPSLSEAVRKQLLGEALFVRAFTHFFLTNTYGDVPLITTTDFRRNTSAPRATVSNVYSQVIEDLLEAQTLLGEKYVTADRTRPNKYVATAFLARVYLYNKDWSNAEIQASALINHDTYLLEDHLDEVFKSTSREAIWQLRPTATSQNTWEGRDFIFEGSPSNYSLDQSLIDSFESNDARLDNWIMSLNNNGATLYFPYKYKIKYTGGFNEYSMVLRLAEQYLIRSEARSMLGNLDGAIADLDEVRDRSSIVLIEITNPTIDKEGLLDAIEQERRHELFIEWGHRWYDLKRMDRANARLAPIKSQWQATDVLYPLPEVEISRNSNLGDNNPGY